MDGGMNGRDYKPTAKGSVVGDGDVVVGEAGDVFVGESGREGARRQVGFRPHDNGSKDGDGSGEFKRRHSE